MKDTPVIFIDADEDDQLMFRRLLAELNKDLVLLTFSDGQAAMDYLSTTPQSPFLIISEISLPKLSGLELRRQIEADSLLRKKSIPFIFMTAPVADYLVEQAYELTIQGLFEKRNTYEGWRNQVKSIIDYWTECVHPKRFGR